MSLCLLPPDSLELLVVSGVDAARFLQGQITCDVDALDEGKLQWAAVCTNKGRVITPFVVFRQADAYCLVFQQGLSRLFRSALARYLPFYKCSIDAGPACHGLVVDVPGSPAVPPGQTLPPVGRILFDAGGWTARLAESPALLTSSRDPDQLLQDDAACDGEEALRLWKLGLMQAGHFPFEPGDTERYTPQELHYDRRDYISFSKGCYTGQEIVARMHYRGKPKKQLYLATLWSRHPALEADAALLDSEGRELAPLLHPQRLAEDRFLALVTLPVDFDTAKTPLQCKHCERVAVHPF